MHDGELKGGLLEIFDAFSDEQKKLKGQMLNRGRVLLNHIATAALGCKQE